ncbi:hypothetical protein [Microcoleus sp. FACHB-672]|uniref:hypothetical protein n=1 Tax=Microcoleus sp. FACHB-672 TaxID=2692825 RepID=UPI001682C652|nr:hypothetical protein [Microcoleus sp. FACHB-672]MBD2042659.1 hypothetical protein [Microcoleus sp. FACHB-672]
MSSPQTIRTIPWLWLIGVFLIYTLIGRFTASHWAVTLAWSWSLSWAVMATWAASLALAWTSMWASALVSRGVWFLVFAVLSALFWFGIGILSLTGFYFIDYLWPLITIWMLFWVFAAAWAVAAAGKDLRQFFSKVHTFLILAGTSWLGLLLGGFLRTLFSGYR